MHKPIDDFWKEFMCLAKPNGGPDFVFRGVTDESFELIPSIGRRTKEPIGSEISAIERDLLNEFRRLAIPILKKQPSSDFEWMFLAQHYGLPTRLLDWTTNSLVALFFAAEEDDEDGAIYYGQIRFSDEYERYDPYSAKKHHYSPRALLPHEGKVIFIRPRYTDNRYLNQKSIFSCPNDPFISLDIPEIKKMVIQRDWKPEIRERLLRLGISASYIYPGLSGIASEVKSKIFNPITSGRRRITTIYPLLED
ncbi:MAG: FRG domain-containing protein [Nitrosomonas sp.]|uniref:FRG domain-containing protein n=1 Tax=Nitrosomonas sp. TaxID=42353 RepID=UPI0032EEF66E